MVEMFGLGSVNTRGVTRLDPHCPKLRAKTTRKWREKQHWNLACFQKTVKWKLRTWLEYCEVIANLNFFNVELDLQIFGLNNS